jgi:hypothetical protein
MEILAAASSAPKSTTIFCKNPPPASPALTTAAIIDSSWYREKLEASRRKLALNYQRELFLKRQHTICVLPPHQLPPPVSPPPPLPPRAACNKLMKPPARIASAKKCTRGSACYKPAIKADALSIQKKPCRSQYSGSACIKAVPKLARLQPSADPSVAHAMKMSTARGLAMCGATQKRRELLKKLGHDEAQPIFPGSAHLPAPAPPVQHPAEESTVSTATVSASCSTSDAQID